MNASASRLIGTLLSGVIVVTGAGCGSIVSTGIGGDGGNDGEGSGGSESTTASTTTGGGAGGADGSSTTTGGGAGGADGSSTTTGGGAGGTDGSSTTTGGGAGGTDGTSTTTGGGPGETGGGVTPGKSGLTWGKYFHDPVLGQDKVGCLGNCNPYVGDTECTESRAILCILKDGSGSNGFVPDFYDGWAAGQIAITTPVAGTTLTSLAAANAACVSAFGTGWEIAEHHDGGGGWAWRAYGNIDDLYNISVAPYDATYRFWVHINDQSGNCWDP